MRPDEKLLKYPATDTYKVLDTIGVPHPYCIHPGHVAYASDHHFGMLTKECIIEAEKHGAKCGICRGQLSFEKHEQALLVAVKSGVDLHDPNNGLKEYLLSIKEMATTDGFVGFAFKEGMSL